MRVVLLINDAPNQAALASKMDAMFDVAGIVVEERSGRGKKSAVDYFSAALERTFFKALRHAWFDMQAYYRDKYFLPSSESITVHSINSDNAVTFIQSLHPDLLVVTGTKMIKEKILSLQIPYGIINLHTGISPYVKGGPNCTNWCLSTNQLHMIGNTVMYLDEGIDSGNIIATEFTPLSGDESLYELHLKVMEHAHDLYIRVMKLMKAKNRCAFGCQQSF